MIRVERLTYDYPAGRALDDVSLTVAEGSITALVGPNGAGKTTLLRCLAALTVPFGGRIMMGGVDTVKDPVACRRLVGYLPDMFGLYDAMTARRTLTYFAEAHRLPAETIPARVAAVAEAVDLTAILDQPVSGFSRGMRQRLGIARALIHDPAVLLLDEPASGLDPEARYSLSRLFVDLSRAGKTLVVSSHILAELDQYATDLAVIRQGRLADQRSLAGPAPDRRRVVIRVTRDPDACLALLSAFPDVVSSQADGSVLTAEITGGDETQRRLLTHLVAGGAAVAEFHLHTPGMKEKYHDVLAA